MKLLTLAAAVAACATFSMTAAAHVGLSMREAPADSMQIMRFQISHGCAGSPTVRIRLRVPEGTTIARPQPKAGWQLATVSGPLAQPFVYHGRTISEGVREVVWSGGRLQHEHFDEFVVQMRLPASAGVVYFPVVQECEQGVHRWIEIPREGQGASELREPAPSLTLTARAAAH